MLRYRLHPHRASSLLAHADGLHAVVVPGSGPPPERAVSDRLRVRMGPDLRAQLKRLRAARSVRVQVALVREVSADIARRVRIHAARAQARAWVRRGVTWSWQGARSAAVRARSWAKGNLRGGSSWLSHYEPDRSVRVRRRPAAPARALTSPDLVREIRVRRRSRAARSRAARAG
jgi:hypothetical protein